VLGLLLPIVLTSVVGALWVGSTTGLQRMRVQWWPLAVGSIAVQLVLYNPPFDQQTWALIAGPWIWVASLVGLLAVCIRNGLFNAPARAAFFLAALGIALNIFVVTANGGFMPQSPEARMAARGIPLVAEGAAPRLLNVLPGGPDTRFGLLSDIIAQPRWLPTANVVSVGDMLLSFALALWAFQMVRLPVAQREFATQTRPRATV
jgi:uncharacterized protein DUF5317